MAGGTWVTRTTTTVSGSARVVGMASCGRRGGGGDSGALGFSFWGVAGTTFGVGGERDCGGSTVCGSGSERNGNGRFVVAVAVGGKIYDHWL